MILHTPHLSLTPLFYSLHLCDHRTVCTLSWSTWMGETSCTISNKWASSRNLRQCKTFMSNCCFYSTIVNHFLLLNRQYILIWVEDNNACGSLAFAWSPSCRSCLWKGVIYMMGYSKACTASKGKVSLCVKSVYVWLLLQVLCSRDRCWSLLPAR